MKTIILIILLPLAAVCGQARPKGFCRLDSMGNPAAFLAGLPGRGLGIVFKGDSVEAAFEGGAKKIKVFGGRDADSSENLIISPAGGRTRIINRFKCEAFRNDTLYLGCVVTPYDIDRKYARDKPEKETIALHYSAVEGLYVHSRARTLLMKSPTTLALILSAVFIAFWMMD